MNILKISEQDEKIVMIDKMKQSKHHSEKILYILHILKIVFRQHKLAQGREIAGLNAYE